MARLGGNEFAVLIEDTQASEDVVRLGECLLQALDKPGTELRPQASLGVTFSDMGYREPDEVLRDADLAMYRAKANGKGCLALFDASLHEHLGHKSFHRRASACIGVSTAAFGRRVSPHGQPRPATADGWSTLLGALARDRRATVTSLGGHVRGRSPKRKLRADACVGIRRRFPFSPKRPLIGPR